MDYQKPRHVPLSINPPSPRIDVSQQTRGNFFSRRPRPVQSRPTNSIVGVEKGTPSTASQSVLAQMTRLEARLLESANTTSTTSRNAFQRSSGVSIRPPPRCFRHSVRQTPRRAALPAPTPAGRAAHNLRGVPRVHPASLFNLIMHFQGGRETDFSAACRQNAAQRADRNSASGCVLPPGSLGWIPMSRLTAATILDSQKTQTHKGRDDK